MRNEALQHCAERWGIAVFALAAAGNRADDSALHEVHGILAQWLDLRGAAAVLVRPDHVVYGSEAGAHAGLVLAQALEDALGATAETAAVV